MKQGTSNPTTSPPQRSITNHAMSEIGVSKIGNAINAYPWDRPYPLVKGTIDQPDGPSDQVLPNGTQKG